MASKKIRKRDRRLTNVPRPYLKDERTPSQVLIEHRTIAEIYVKARYCHD